MPTIEKCVVCRAEYESRRFGSMYCGRNCKMRACRRRQAIAREAAETHAALVQDLLRRQTLAVAQGADAAVFATLAREAQALLGADLQDM